MKIFVLFLTREKWLGMTGKMITLDFLWALHSLIQSKSKCSNTMDTQKTLPEIEM